jgi:uncharacterized OB-fold protein
VTAAPVHEGLFSVDPPALLGQRCRACGRAAFPRSADCPLCGAADPEPVTLPSTGTLWAWTAVTARPPGYAGDVPFGFGIVELPGGLRVVSRLAQPVDGYTFGQPMALHVVEIGTDDGAVLTWQFSPAGDPRPGSDTRATGP